MTLMIVLAGAAEGGRRGGGLDVMLLMLVPIVFIFWFMSRSQRKKDQERKDMLGRIKKGDQVVTVGGVHGEIVRLNDREVVLAVDKSRGVELRLQRTAISSVSSSKASAEGAPTTQQEGSGTT